MKKLAKAMISRLPLRMKIGVARTIANDRAFGQAYGREIMSLLAPAAGVVGFVADGKYGAIESAPGDLSVHKTYAQSGNWAGSTVNRLREFFSQHGSYGTYLDIGANIGLTTIPIAQEFSEVKCLAFEPEPRNFSYLQGNVKRNCVHQNVNIYNVALFSDSSRLTLEIAEKNLGDHRIRTKPGEPYDVESLRRTVTVEALPLDHLHTNITEPLGVKIDTQGAEPFIFAGGKKVLARAGIIIMEWCPYMMRRMGGDHRIICDFLSTHFTACKLIEKEDQAGGKMMSVDGALAVLEQSFDRDEATKMYYDLIVANPLGIP